MFEESLQSCERGESDGLEFTEGHKIIEYMNKYSYNIAKKYFVKYGTDKACLI